MRAAQHIDTDWLANAGVPAHARSVRIDDLGALTANWRHLADRAAPAVCAAVVKAHAYGLSEAAPHALARAGCGTFFVATLEEGMRWRAAVPEAVIFILDGLLVGAEEAYAANTLRPVLSTPKQIAAWSRFCGARRERLPAAIHIDTGMSRLGLTAADVGRLVDTPDLLATFEIALVMTHPASADDPADEMTRRQFDAFNALRAKLPAAPASFANSPGIFHDGMALDLVRPGIALYGGRPGAPPIPTLDRVVHVFARVLQVRTINAGETVGYGASFAAERESRIATLAFGYADGFNRALGNLPPDQRPNVWFGAHAAPIVGRVSMDLITVDVTDLPDGSVTEGGWAELIGRHQSVDDLADRIGTIGYEILTSLKLSRCHQILVGGPETPAAETAAHG
jgi:alanine racemase